MVQAVPPSEIDLIIAHILKKSREFVLTHPEIRLNKAQKRRLKNLVNRRNSHEPLAYIIGRKEFYCLDFKVGKDTLIPRPETELLVEEVIKLHPKNSNIIDIGTGSGNIIVALAKNIKKKNKYFAIDISSGALRIAKLNAKKNKVGKKIKFIKSDLLKKFLRHTGNKMRDNIIIANLPYLSKKIYSQTPPDVKNFEPKSALLSGKHGLDHYEKLFIQMKSLKDKNSKLKAFLEISPEQKTIINRLIKNHFPQAQISYKKDLSGKWRMVKILL